MRSRKSAQGGRVPDASRPSLEKPQAPRWNHLPDLPDTEEFLLSILLTAIERSRVVSNVTTELYSIAIRKWKRKCPSSNEHQLSAPD